MVARSGEAQDRRCRAEAAVAEGKVKEQAPGRAQGAEAARA